MTLGILAFSEGPLSSLGKQDAIAVVTGQALTVALGAELLEQELLLLKQVKI